MDTKIQFHAKNNKKGEIMQKNELINVVGGVSFSPTLLNAVTKAVSLVYDISRRVGSTVYRIVHNAACYL